MNPMSDPNAGILEEISDQQLDEFSAGTFGGAEYVVSFVMGNLGNFCTATLECQKNCV